ncbi:hypothetical protein [Acinetobacter sp. CWB-B33]|uniref:hypothetical protein n=1 Tax=Acinetobacter sp. CWB-B33 TaxID=2815724 RepID=UPI0031FF3CCA
MSKEKQDDWKRTQIRIPIGLYEDVAQHAERHNLSLNYAMLELMDRGIHSISSKNKNTDARSIYFGEFTCDDDIREVPLVKQQEKITAVISDIFFKNPQYQLLNIETLDNGEKIRYWYSIPRGESFRD